MSEPTKEIVPAPGLVTARGLVLRTTDDIKKFVATALRAGRVPRGLDTPEKAFMAVAAGLELGFGPVQSLTAFGDVQGKMCLYGESGRALFADLLDEKSGGEWFEYEGHQIDISDYMDLDAVPDGLTAVVRVKRKGGASAEGRFSVAQAKAAKLWKKLTKKGLQTTWWTYYPDQLMWKARWRADRKIFADRLKGIKYHEEVADYEDISDAEYSVVGDFAPAPEPAAEQPDPPSVAEPTSDFDASLDAEQFTPPPEGVQDTEFPWDGKEEG